MKIVIVNKFLYPRGGDCICTLNLGELLISNGHEVRYFAMDYPDNIECSNKDYFPEEVSFSSLGIKNKIKAATRLLNGNGVIDKFTKLINDFKPDVVHLNNIHSYLSPIVVKLAHQHNIKTVWTLHDYKLICPAYSCLRNGSNCEECFNNKSKVLVNKCMKGSTIASVLAYLEALRWNRVILSKWTDTFICPSTFIATKMKQGGYDSKKMAILCNFINDQKVDMINKIIGIPEKAYCYVGRLSEEKGVDNLLKVASKLPYKLYIAGTGPLENELKEKYKSENIVFLGHLSYEKVISLLKSVQFSVMPSICYENNPLGVIESLCCGTPVLGSKIGGIPELLENDSCALFIHNDLNDLHKCIVNMFNKELIDPNKLSNESIKRFSSLQYYNSLMEIYNK